MGMEGVLSRVKKRFELDKMLKSQGALTSSRLLFVAWPNGRLVNHPMMGYVLFCVLISILTYAATCAVFNILIWKPVGTKCPTTFYVVPWCFPLIPRFYVLANMELKIFTCLGVDICYVFSHVLYSGGDL